ncbi:hypothetical protein [Nitrosomonas communis]|uniref:hypothetical protein n=1 Tax=Nitrosomonas communis TaxID=44574 RepID=UPI0015A508A1|nr:hypothetical protein [Nitrosomonas communis]
MHEAPRSAPEVKLLCGVLEVKARGVFDRRLDQVLSQTLWVKEKLPIRLLSCKSNG